MAVVKFLPEAREDLKDFDRSVQILLLKAAAKLKDSPEQRGEPLGAKANGQSNLTGFRKLVVGNRDYRIVYRVEPDGTVVVIWVIGARVDSEVYEIANARLKLYSAPEKQLVLQAILDAAFPQP